MGATSAIAEATAREFARRGDSLLLVGRSAERLQAIASDLRIRGANEVHVCVHDARDMNGFPILVNDAARLLGGLDAALIAHGSLPDQRDCEQSIERTVQEVETNALSVAALCTPLANYFESSGHGVLAIISSVAGERGRRSNYVYGASKAFVTAFTSGLRQRLHSKGVQVVTIKPGFVDSPMTARFAKGPLWASPSKVAKEIDRAMLHGTSVIYVPWFWRPIMALIRALPEVLFKRLRL